MLISAGGPGEGDRSDEGSAAVPAREPVTGASPRPEPARSGGDDPVPTHRRFDPLADRWVLVSAGRVARPWNGGREQAAEPTTTYDPDCHLCPGNARASGIRNPRYSGVHVFDNDFPALRPDTRFAAPAGPVGAGPVGAVAAGLLRAEPESGACRVVCFDPHHDRALASLPAERVRTVVDTWAEQERELGRSWRWVQIFENRGAAMGASSPHPHGQIWATSSLPDAPATEDRTQLAYLRSHGVPLLVDYAAVEAELGAAGTSDGRVVVADDHWLVVVPYWAVWPFETLVLPRRPVGLLHHLTSTERDALASVLGRLLRSYDALFDHPFPYSMGWHGAPGPHPDPDVALADHWQLHAHFYPPLLRSPTIRKHMVGYDMLAGVQRDITPEDAAARLRAARPPAG